MIRRVFVSDQSSIFPPCPNCGEPLPLTTEYDPGVLGAKGSGGTPIYKCPNCGFHDKLPTTADTA